MASVAPHRAFGQNELPVHSADDLASRQQKMQQQRQLALKRQQHLTKSCFGTGVTAQLDTPFDISPQKKTAGWEKMLMRCGIDVGLDGVVCAPQKVPLDDPAGFVRIRVPFAEEVGPSLRAATQPSPNAASLQAVAQDVSIPSTAAVANSDADPQQAPNPTTPRRAEVDNCFDVQSETKSPEKPRGFKLWRPWGGSKRANAGSEDMRGTETIVEEKRVSLSLADTDGAGERCTTLNIGRASTPFQPETEDLLEESLGSDVSAIPGFADADDDEQEESLQGINDMLAAELNEVVDAGDDDSVDSGIENTFSEWKAQEKHSPTEKKSRFNRFIPSVPTSWRTPKIEISAADSAVTRIMVTPRVVDTDPVDLD